MVLFTESGDHLKIAQAGTTISQTFSGIGSIYLLYIKFMAQVSSLYLYRSGLETLEYWHYKIFRGVGGRSPPRKFCGKMEHFLRKNAKNVTHSDEVHREKLQKKVTILHILSSKLVVPTAKFANNVINFRKRLANLQTITRKF